MFWPTRSKIDSVDRKHLAGFFFILRDSNVKERKSVFWQQKFNLPRSRPGCPLMPTNSEYITLYFRVYGIE